MREINKDWYCSAGHYEGGRCHQGCMSLICKDERGGCGNYHRKHPTPEQFKQEFGLKYLDDGAVYAWRDGIGWVATFYKAAKVNEHYDTGFGFGVLLFAPVLLLALP